MIYGDSESPLCHPWSERRRTIRAWGPCSFSQQDVCPGLAAHRKHMRLDLGCTPEDQTGFRNIFRIRGTWGEFSCDIFQPFDQWSISCNSMLQVLLCPYSLSSTKDTYELKHAWTLPDLKQTFWRWVREFRLVVLVASGSLFGWKDVCGQSAMSVASPLLFQIKASFGGCAWWSPIADMGSNPFFFFSEEIVKKPSTFLISGNEYKLRFFSLIWMSPQWLCNDVLASQFGRLKTKTTNNGTVTYIHFIPNFDSLKSYFWNLKSKIQDPEIPKSDSLVSNNLLPSFFTLFLALYPLRGSMVQHQFPQIKALAKSKKLNKQFLKRPANRSSSCLNVSSLAKPFMSRT